MIPALLACGLAGATCHRTTGAALDALRDGPDLDRASVAVELVPIAEGCGRVVDLDVLPGGDLLVTDQEGTVYRLGPKGSGTVFARVSPTYGGERGLLGLALHPKHAENGRFYLNYTTKVGEALVSRVAEWRVGPSGTSEHHMVYELPQPYGNHNGGHLLFGDDGLLYVGFGDGGHGNDPHGNGQDRSTALGSMLRLDVDTAPYAVPPDNPFVGQGGALPEVWATGLRNPWRYTFDGRGRLVVADVGQGQWEEIGFVGRGENAGWNFREGRSCLDGPCATQGFREPFWVYGRDAGTSVTGGVVPASGPLAGQYVFGDYISGRMWALTLPDSVDGTVDDVRALGRFGVHPATFGHAPDGGLLVADHITGTVYAVRTPED